MLEREDGLPRSHGTRDVVAPAIVSRDTAGRGKTLVAGRKLRPNVGLSANRANVENVHDQVVVFPDVVSKEVLSTCAGMRFDDTAKRAVGIVGTGQKHVHSHRGEMRGVVSKNRSS